MKHITNAQIDSVLQGIYQTNISAKDYDAIIGFFRSLPECDKPTVDNVAEAPTVKKGKKNGNPK